MVNEVAIDFSKARRRKRRSKREINRYWDLRYNRFLTAGFTEREATWAADEGLSPRKKQVRDVLSHRRALVAWFMKRYNITRGEAISRAAEELEERLDKYAVEEMNLFYETSP